MSDQPTQDEGKPPVQNIYPSQPPSPSEPKSFFAKWWLLIIIAVVVLLGVIASFAAGGNDATTEPTSSPSTGVETAAPAYTPPPRPAEPVYREPTVDDFIVEIYETEKQCFGSAGCNVTFTVDLTNLTGVPLDPAKTYELRYEVLGAEDPLLSTLDITGENYSSYEEYVSTASESAELTVNLLDIRER